MFTFYFVAILIYETKWQKPEYQFKLFFFKVHVNVLFYDYSK